MKDSEVSVLLSNGNMHCNTVIPLPQTYSSYAAASLPD
jgi:hypothetical protein